MTSPSIAITISTATQTSMAATASMAVIARRNCPLAAALEELVVLAALGEPEALAAQEVLAALAELVVLAALEEREALAALAAQEVLVALEELAVLAAAIALPSCPQAQEVAIDGSTILPSAAVRRIETAPLRNGLADQLVETHWLIGRLVPGNRSGAKAAIWPEIVME